MSAAQLAAVRACARRAERHEPLTMTPGDLRTLLGRYQRRLHDLAEAVLPPAAMADHLTIALLPIFMSEIFCVDNLAMGMIVEVDGQERAACVADTLSL